MLALRNTTPSLHNNTPALHNTTPVLHNTTPALHNTMLVLRNTTHPHYVTVVHVLPATTEHCANTTILAQGSLALMAQNVHTPPTLVTIVNAVSSNAPRHWVTNGWWWIVDVIDVVLSILWRMLILIFILYEYYNYTELELSFLISSIQFPLFVGASGLCI